jgi:hypothetical protein
MTGSEDDLNVIVTRDSNGNVPADTLVTCDGFTTFPFSALADPVPIEDSGLVKIKAELDQSISEAGDPWPQKGWLVLDQSDKRVLLVYVDAETVGFMVFRSTRKGWEWEGSSLNDRCRLRSAMPAGLGEVDWRFDPAFPRPDRDTTVVHLLVTERGCASGQPMGDRLRGPQVVATDDSVLIAFAATPPEGNEQTCPGNPSAAVTVELPAPLGERTIRDGRLIASDLAELIETEPSATPTQSPSTARPLLASTT